MKKNRIYIWLSVFIVSCTSPKRDNCIDIDIREKDYCKQTFSSLAPELKNKLIELFTKDQKYDTAFSLSKDITYSYSNPGEGKGYVSQVLSGENKHYINGVCYRFVFFSKPYVVFKNKLYSFDQILPLNCDSGRCIPDTLGIGDSVVYSLDIEKLKQ